MVASNDQGHAVADELMSDPVMRRAPMIRRDPMADTPQHQRWDPQIRRAPNASGLYDVLDLILDKGIVIDAFVRVSLVGIELLTVDLRIVVASVDTYLRYAEGVERLQVYNRSGAAKLPDVVGGGMRFGAMKKATSKVKEVADKLTGDGDEDEDEQDDGEGITGTITHGLKRGIGKIVGSITGSGSEDDEGEDQGEEGEERDEGDEDEGEARQSSGRRERERAPARQSRDGGRAKAGSRR
jgi:hypothetical protein